MVFVAVWTGLRVSELIGLKWEDVGADSLTIDERCCRGDWDAPKSEASNATIGVEPCVIERIHRLKQLTVDVKAGLAGRHYKVVKSDRPEDLVFQSVKTGAPMRDNNILTRHIKPAARKLGLPWINWRCLRTSHAAWMVGKMRYVPLLPEVAGELRRYPVVISDDRVFPPRKGAYGNRRRLEGSFEDLLRFASWYMMNGGDLYELAKILGHSNIKMTERYAKLERKHIARTGNTAREIWKIMGQEEGNKTNIVCEKTR